MPFQRRGIGNYSNLMIRSLAMAEQMQAAAIDRIKEDFATREFLDLRDGISYGDFVRQLAEAEENGTRDEFEAMLGRQIIAAMSAPPEAPMTGQA